MSAESLLSVIASVPAVPGAAAASSVTDGEAPAFEGLLAEAMEAAPVEEAETTDAAATPAVAPPMTLPILVETQPVEPAAPAPAQTPAPAATDFKALLEAAEPQVLPGPIEVAPDPATDAAAQPAPVAEAGDAAPAAQTPTEASAAVAAAVAAVAPPPARPAPERTSPLMPTDKGVTKKAGEDPNSPPVLPGPPDTDVPSRPFEPTPPTDRPRPGLTLKTDGAMPALDRPSPPPVTDPTLKNPAAADPALKLDAGEPVVIARDAGASGLSRAAIETTAQIAAQITRKLEGRSTRFEMALTPEGLGRVDVSLDIDADGQLAARLAFDNPVAAMDLRGRVDELRRQLEDQGFKLAQDALQFTDRDPQSRGDGFDGRRERAFARSNRLADDTDLEISAPAAGRWMSLSLTPDRVDLKV